MINSVVCFSLPFELASHLSVGESDKNPKDTLFAACKGELGHRYLYVVDSLENSGLQRHTIVHADHVQCLQAGTYFSLDEPEWTCVLKESSDPFGALAGTVNAALTGESREVGSCVWARAHVVFSGRWQRRAPMAKATPRQARRAHARDTFLQALGSTIPGAQGEQ
jgi:hypothetical protein